MEYKASLDNLAKIISICTIAIIILVGWRIYKAIIASIGNPVALAIYCGAAVILILVLVIPYGLAPQNYILNNDELIVKRLLISRKIKLDELEEARMVEKEEVKNTIRTFGVGGLFGYFGKYYNPKLGSMTWYLTQRENRILLITKKGEKILISPDDTSLLISIKQKIKV
jgi:hypothetical protein